MDANKTERETMTKSTTDTKDKTPKARKAGRPKKDKLTYNWDILFKDWHCKEDNTIFKTIEIRKHKKIKVFRSNPSISVGLIDTVFAYNLPKKLRWIREIDTETVKDLRAYIDSQWKPKELAKKQAVQEQLDKIKAK